MKALIHKEIEIKSAFTYQNFLKKGYRVVPKLTLRLSEHHTSSRERKGAIKKKILGIFRNTKAIQKLDVSALKPLKSKFWCSTFRYIAKRASSVLDLKVRDFREPTTKYQELVGSWPKYMKNLSSLSSQVGCDFPTTVEEYNEQKQMKPMSYYLKYLPKLAMIEVKFPHHSTSIDLNGIWKFEKYPVSLKKLHFVNVSHGDEPIQISVAHLKNLKDVRFGIGKVYENSIKTLKSVMNLISQVPQLEALDIDLINYFKIDASMCIALRSLKKLKKVKLSMFSENGGENLKKILTCLEGCPLEDLALRVEIDFDCVVTVIKDFVEKKQTGLKSLNLELLKYHPFKSSNEIEDLLKTIDTLPHLASLCFTAKTALIYDMVPSSFDFPFEKLFLICSLKRFGISMNQFTFGQDGFVKLLKALGRLYSTLEELYVDFGRYQPQDYNERVAIIESIKAMKNISSLKLNNLDIPSKLFFLEFVEAIENLRFLRDLSLGEISDNVTKESYFDGMRRILSKNGFEILNCTVSIELQKENSEGGCFCINSQVIQRKNPSLKQGPGFKAPHEFWANLLPIKR